MWWKIGNFIDDHFLIVIISIVAIMISIGVIMDRDPPNGAKISESRAIYKIDRELGICYISGIFSNTLLPDDKCKQLIGEK